MNNANYKNQTFLLLLEIIQISNILIMVAVTSREQIFGFFELVPARFGPRINCRISPGWTPLFGTRVLNSPIGLPTACASTVTLDELFLFYFFFPIHVVRKKHGLNVFFLIFFSGRQILYCDRWGKKYLRLKRKDVIWCICDGTFIKLGFLMVKWIIRGIFQTINHFWRKHNFLDKWIMKEDSDTLCS